MTERIEALEFRAKRLANAADAFWRCSLALAVLLPVLEAALTARIPITALVASAVLLLIAWVVREYLFVAVAQAEVVAEQAARRNSFG